MKKLRQAAKFGKAWTKWMVHGQPKRSPELVTHIFHNICKPCEHYDPDHKECSICECLVSGESNEQNKIIYATESCPIGKWDGNT